jgi:hypothetical protein
LFCLAGPSSEPAKAEPGGSGTDDDDDDDDDEVEIVPESDAERVRAMREAGLGAGDGALELAGLRSAGMGFAGDFVMPSRGGVGVGGGEVIEVSSEDEVGLPGPSKGEARETLGASCGFIRYFCTRADLTPPTGPSAASSFPPQVTTAPKPKPKPKAEPGLKLGKIVQDEVAFRKKESVGLVGAGSVRTLGGRARAEAQDPPRARPALQGRGASGGPSSSDGFAGGGWECLVCTL